MQIFSIISNFPRNFQIKNKNFCSNAHHVYKKKIVLSNFPTYFSRYSYIGLNIFWLFVSDQKSKKKYFRARNTLSKQVLFLLSNGSAISLRRFLLSLVDTLGNIYNKRSLNRFRILFFGPLEWHCPLINLSKSSTRRKKIVVKGDPIRCSRSFLKIKHLKINLIIKNCIWEVSSVCDI